MWHIMQIGGWVAGFLFRQTFEQTLVGKKAARCQVGMWVPGVLFEKLLGLRVGVESGGGGLAQGLFQQCLEVPRVT